MQVERCASARKFLDATAAYRDAEPLRTNVLGTVATSVADGVSSYEECFWWVVHDGDAVVAAAMRTAPQALALGPMGDTAAAVLASAIAAVDDELPVVSGARAAVSAFLGAYRTTGTPGSAREVTAEERHVLYAVEAVKMPEVSGQAVVASTDDESLAAAWYAAFDEEVEGIPAPKGSDGRPAVRGVLGEGRLRWWRHDGTTVSMAAHSTSVGGPAAAVTRIGPVYTPPLERRHGYAAALTAALAQELLATGSLVMLFADAANPTSNHVYQGIGFQRVDEIVRVHLAVPMGEPRTRR